VSAGYDASKTSRWGTSRSGTRDGSTDVSARDVVISCAGNLSPCVRIPSVDGLDSAGPRFSIRKLAGRTLSRCGPAIACYHSVTAPRDADRAGDPETRSSRWTDRLGALTEFVLRRSEQFRREVARLDPLPDAGVPLFRRGTVRLAGTLTTGCNPSLQKDSPWGSSRPLIECVNYRKQAQSNFTPNKNQISTTIGWGSDRRSSNLVPTYPPFGSAFYL